MSREEVRFENGAPVLLVHADPPASRTASKKPVRATGRVEHGKRPAERLRPSDRHASVEKRTEAVKTSLYGQDPAVAARARGVRAAMEGRTADPALEGRTALVRRVLYGEDPAVRDRAAAVRAPMEGSRP